MAKNKHTVALDTGKVKNQGQGEKCECGHHQLYHASYGPCMVLNCKCQEFYPPKQEPNDGEE